jgi:hypothetical protein
MRRPGRSRPSRQKQKPAELVDGRQTGPVPRRFARKTGIKKPAAESRWRVLDFSE